ncbi:MAG: hypothetical protein HYT37_02395 [Candidatus Sungbacteria bacterium]|nr:hypothetical protein [Candidatus Sungbacteria bacterium]
MISYGFFTAIIIAFLVGGFACLIDMHLGAWLRRGVYNYTHKDALIDSDESGYIYRRNANIRFGWAIALVLLTHWCLIHYAIINIPISVISIPLELAAIMIGFYAGPFLNKIWERRKPLLDTIDKMDSGETDVKKEVRKVVEQVKDAFHVPTDSEQQKSAQKESAVETKTLSAKIEENPQKYIDAFTKGT